MKQLTNIMVNSMIAVTALLSVTAAPVLADDAQRKQDRSMPKAPVEAPAARIVKGKNTCGTKNETSMRELGRKH